MRPEVRLDAHLTALRQSWWGVSSAERPALTQGADAEGDLGPQLEAAARMEPLTQQAPDPTFAADLRARMLSRAAQRRDPRQSASPVAHTQHADAPDVKQRRRVVGIRSRQMGVWAGLAAALLVAFIGAGALEAAAQAGPASPLFPLRRLEQSYRAAAAGDSATRADLHLRYARQWMQATVATAQQGGSGVAFDDALDAMRQEDGAAADEIAQMPQGAARASEQTKLASLYADERVALSAALAQHIAWENRLRATTALAALGGQAPAITSVSLTAQPGAWQVTLVGTGFEPGAALVMDGAPVGQVISLSPTQLVALAPKLRDGGQPRQWGIANPDGTAAAASPVNGTSGRPSTTVTPGDHGGPPTSPQHGTDGGSATDGKGQAPTPTVSGATTPAPTPTQIGRRDP